ncbi:MAG: hypothetical protein IJV00_05385, partial [Clostridia bacterium]|nr:hypothetical protein [Clostridia bacterium]
IPAKGWRVVTPEDRKIKVKKIARGMENEWYRLKFDKNCNIVSVWDKKASREILKSGEAVRFSAYEDLNAHYDAWEISRSYREKRYSVDEVTGTVWLEEGDRTGFRVTRLFSGSVITDTVWLCDNEPRVDFEDEVDWKTRHVLLKREFPVAAVASSATCEIQFGCVERPTHANTSWDAAKYEVCAHKYVDISESDWGVAIMNDSKFGHSLYDNVIGLSLLRGPTDPDKNCDIGVHSFRYALYSHAGNAAAGGVSRAAYAFNDPPRAVLCPGGGDLADVFSLVSSSDGRFFTDTVKPAEDGRGVIVRGYEADRSSGKTTLKFGAKVLRAEINDLEENFVSPIEAKNDSVTLPFKPFEIVTLRVFFEGLDPGSAPEKRSRENGKEKSS